MAITIIKEGDPDKQGNAVCPQCGERVEIEECFGDPPKCGCGTPYETIPRPIRYS